jgi:hypothetical protein
VVEKSYGVIDGIWIFSPPQEFGIDIVSEDNKTVVHRKVAAKAYCVFNVDDAGMSARFVKHPL